MKFKFIVMHKTEHRVNTLCHMFGVTVSGYYQWRNRGKSNRAMENKYLVEKIKADHQKSRCVYGSPRITQALNRESITCSQPRVARLMRENGIVAKTQRKFKVATNSNHNLPVAPNLVNQAFGVEGPNRLWVGDITYVDTNEGWTYLTERSSDGRLISVCKSHW